MKCPHCKQLIEMSPKLWQLWYRDDLRQRVIAQTDNPSLADLIVPRGAGGAVTNAIQSVEDFTAAMCLAWQRGTLLSRDRPGQHGG